MASGGMMYVASNLGPAGELLTAFEYTRCMNAAREQGMTMTQLRMFCYALELGEFVPEEAISSFSRAKDT